METFYNLLGVRLVLLSRCLGMREGLRDWVPHNNLYNRKTAHDNLISSKCVRTSLLGFGKVYQMNLQGNGITVNEFNAWLHNTNQQELVEKIRK